MGSRKHASEICLLDLLFHSFSADNGRRKRTSFVLLNWPYGHGLPLDDICKRARDIASAFNGSENDLKEVVDAYRVGYVYVGGEELRSYPRCVEKFEGIDWLKPVYNVGNLRIYQVYLSQN